MGLTQAVSGSSRDRQPEAAEWVPRFQVDRAASKKHL